MIYWIPDLPINLYLNQLPVWSNFKNYNFRWVIRIIYTDASVFYYYKEKLPDILTKYRRLQWAVQIRQRRPRHVARPEPHLCERDSSPSSGRVNSTLLVVGTVIRSPPPGPCPSKRALPHTFVGLGGLPLLKLQPVRTLHRPSALCLYASPSPWQLLYIGSKTPTFMTHWFTEWMGPIQRSTNHSEFFLLNIWLCHWSNDSEQRGGFRDVPS